MQEPCWLEEFKDTCQDIMEDTFLLDAVSKYIANDHYFMPGDQLDCALLVYCRLCGLSVPACHGAPPPGKTVRTGSHQEIRPLTQAKSCGKLNI